jgi:hypothetical protein
MANGRVLLALAVPDRCDPPADGTVSIEAVVFDPSTSTVETLGPVPAIGTCSGAPASTVSPLLDGTVLIAGGLSAGGENEAAASLVKEGETSR